MLSLSIVVTYYKGKEFILNCIDSIQKSHHASSKLIDYEVIIVIDSMEDADSIELLLLNTYDDLNLIVIKNYKNLGVSTSRNNGLQKVKHQFFTIIDQDDYVNIEYFETIEKELDSAYPIHIINGVIRYMDENIEVPIYTFTPRFKFKNLILKDTFIYTPGLIIFNTSIIDSNNLFIDTSEKYKGCDDLAAYLSLLLKFEDKIKFKYINSKLFVYCLHSNNYSNNKEEMILSSIAVLNYTAKLKSATAYYLRLINTSLGMQEFYLFRNVKKYSLPKLFVKFPNQFFYHYLISLMSIDHTNKIILKIRYYVMKKIKQIKSN